MSEQSIPTEEIDSGRRIKSIGTISDESLCFSAEKVIKEHQNERMRLKNLGKLIPIDGSEGDLQESSPMPVPLRRKGFNPTNLFEPTSPETSAMECDLESYPSSRIARRSNMKDETRRTTKTVNFGTVEEISIDELQKQQTAGTNGQETTIEDKVDLLLKKMDSVLEKLNK